MEKMLGITRFHLGWLVAWIVLCIFFLLMRWPLFAAAAFVGTLCVPHEPDPPGGGSEGPRGPEPPVY